MPKPRCCSKHLSRLLFYFFCFTATHAFTQSLIEPVWSKSLNGSTNGSAEGWGVDVDSEGNIYWPPSIDSTGVGRDIYCYKFDPDGNELWNAPLFFGGPGTQHSYACNAKHDALYIGGRFCAFSGLSCDMQLLKVDKINGALLWDRMHDFGNDGYDEIDGIYVSDEGIQCSGWAQVLETGPYRLDMGLWKLDAAGNTLWTNHAGKTGSAEHLDGHIAVDDDFIYACGLVCGISLFNLFNGSSFLGKFDKSNGTLVDSVLFGTQSLDPLDAENALGMASDGTHLYLTGYTTPPGLGNWQIFIAKFDKNLNQLWTVDWGGSEDETARAIAVANGIIYIGGQSQSPEYSPGGGADALLLEFDTDGNYLRHATYGDSLNNSIRDLVVSDGAIYLSGTSQEDLALAGLTAFLLKVDDGITGLEDIEDIDSDAETSEMQVQVYPNPAASQFTMDFGEAHRGAVDLVIYDQLGNSVYSQTHLSKAVELSFTPGIYYYEATNQAGQVAKGKIVLQR